MKSEEKYLDKIIDKEELEDIVPYCLSHLSRLEHAGLFPKRIKLGKRRVGWSMNEILDWINQKKESRN